MVGNPQDEFEHIDADAVCEACANVNPPGTLLCKVCGNNLRDQRVRRMQAGGPVEVKEPTFQIGRILRGVGAVVAFVVLGIVALNVESIEKWMTSGIEAQTETAEGVHPEVYWDEPQASTYAEMLATLEENPLTVAQASLVPPGSPSSSFDGLYILKRSTDPTATVLGSALVKTEGETLLFVAKLAGGTEIRGAGAQNSERLAEAINIGSRDPDGAVTSAYGLAQMAATGEVVCTGMFGDQDFTVSAVAIPVPEDMTAIAEPVQEEAPREALIDPIRAAEEAAAAAEAEESAPAQP